MTLMIVIRTTRLNNGQIYSLNLSSRDFHHYRGDRAQCIRQHIGFTIIFKIAILLRSPNM